MLPKEYIQKALRTEHGSNEKYGFPATGDVTPRIEHAALGLVTEAGELIDQIKKTKIYGRKLDRANLMEEAGDIMWYLALLSDELGVSFEEIWEKNIAKLLVRYSKQYTKKEALLRNVDKEREIFEQPPG